ncbi:MAG TPA: hypothetical protein VEK07_16725 [Polyangiaceae bacterium]|nr:hypothetical protein [Polyangiaceae bacterium]
MRARAWRLALTGTVASLVTMPRVAGAASPTARLTYVRSIDSASCPDEAALRRAVAARFGYDPFFPWARKTVVVHIGHEAAHFVAHVELVDESGLTRGTRDLHADDDDCAQIFNATALAISIALDAFATSPAEEASPVAPPEGGALAPPAPLVPPPTTAPAPAAPETVLAVRDRSRSPVLVGADVLGAVGAAPGPSAGLGAFVAARTAAASIELRLHGDASAPIAVGPVGRVETARFAATIAPCARFGLVTACGVAEVGWLQAWGSDLAVVRSEAMPFVAAGARVGVALPISDALLLRIYAESVFDLDRANFELDYYDRWTAPLLEGTLAFGLARRIP